MTPRTFFYAFCTLCIIQILMVSLEKKSLSIMIHDNDPISARTNDNVKLHPLVMDQTIETLIKNTNSSDYKWLGNHWIVPPGVPTFTPRQIRAYFKKRNVLVIGDSTSRRFYATLFGILTADDLDNVRLDEVNNGKLLNENKGRKNRSMCTRQQNRSIAKTMTAMMGSTCKDWGGDEGEDEENKDKHNSTSNSSSSELLPLGSVKLDYAYQFSFKSMVEMWRDGPNNDNMQGFQNDYDLVIIGIGIWEQVRPQDTIEPVEMLPNTTAAERARVMLELMQRNNPKNLQVVIRTSGFDSRRITEQTILHQINAEERQFFYDLETGTNATDRYAKNNLTLVDWGGVIQHRSYGMERLFGDTSNHYDTEARLLFIQQLMHELIKSELQ